MRLSSIAIRAASITAMRDFYTEAFGFRFAPATLGPLHCWFGEHDGLTLKLVPLRDSANFGDFPVHQLGFAVADIDAAIALALAHGGSVQDSPTLTDNRHQASIRDPDGNTIEICATVV